jgi:hypothetical protein
MSAIENAVNIAFVAAMVGATVSHYRILEKLGAGAPGRAPPSVPPALRTA